ncbi:helix-turn-helix domain-containing protein [Sphingobium nicotianae]|uniref:Helix-turn-helix domain-containing protein n=1 Tax=Sphingobium nicotianae TaxID=2782607 RepID=A0A9X1IPE9_9SPHN|nr:helix-turn-helix domain-containing protein [Sphingobium nicotianae]MBT2186118.1 helix-turn-helix domain-containing protein [Sphingobium nicotianae]
MGRVHSVSTVGIAAAERVFFWNSGSSAIGGVRATPLADIFDAEASTRILGRLLVFGLKAGPHHVASPAHCRMPGCEEDFLRVRFQRSGESLVEQSGVRHTIRAGEWLVIDGARPHSVVNERDASQISLQLPKSLLSERDYRLATTLSAPIETRGRISKLLFECLRMTIEDLDDLSDPAEQELGLSLLEMLRIIINDASSAHERASSRDALERRVHDYVRCNLSNPALSVETIATAMGCSPRYIHKVFEGQESVSRMIWSLRLQRCKEALMATSGTSATLTELAYNFGFSNSAHFSRAFKERFGTTPSAFRSKVLENRANKSWMI